MADTVRIEIAVEATDNTGKALESVVKNLQGLAKAAGGAQAPLDKASEKVTKFDEQAGRTQKTLQSWMKQKWQLALEAKDKISPVLSTVKGVLSSLFGRAWNITLKAFDFVTAPVRGILNILKNPVFQAGSILGVTIGLKDTIDTYKNFEAAMSQVGAVSGATGSDLERLTVKAKEMGATTKFTATEAAEAFNYMAMAGWKTGDMMNGIEGIMSLAAASGEDLATTSDIVTDALTAFGLTAADAGHFADILAAASSNANTNVAMMGETFKYAAPIVGALYGEGERATKGMEDAALAIGLMANAGIKSAQAGTSLRSILTRLSTNAGATKNSLGALDILTQKLGVSFYDSSGAVRDMSDILTEARAAWAGLSAEQQTSYAKTIAGQYAMSGWLAMMNAAPADVEKLTEAIEHADGAAERMKDTMLDNLQGSFTLLQSALDGVKLSLGERLAPYFRSLAEGLTGAMPAIERAVTEFMDWFDGKVDEFKARYREALNTDGFADKDLFGKIEILWDKIIAEPFFEWWNGNGKQMFANVANDIGSGIGAGLKSGILMLLGIDVSDAASEGASIGRSFAEGFMSGFQSDGVGKDVTADIGADYSSGGGGHATSSKAGTKSVGSAFASFTGGLLSNVGKILPGGKAPGLDTALSAFMLYKMASPVIALGKGAATIGKSIFTAPEGGTSLASWMLGHASETASARPTYEQIRQSGGALTYRDRVTNTVRSGTGIMGGLEKVGVALGSKSTGAGAAAVGGASILGGAVALGTAISGIKDVYKAVKSEDREERSATAVSGGLKLGGVATGAAIGSMILPGAGTLIGAGIGGAIGYISGNSIKKHYEEQAQAAKDAANAQELINAKAAYTGQSLENVTFRSKELNESFHDSEVSVERFGAMFREAVSDKITSSFGNITLSMQEIKSLADSIVFDAAFNGVEKFENAVAVSGKALSGVKSDIGALEKMNWKASLGLNFSQSDLTEYQAQVDSFIKNAQSYITDKHYEATVALKLLTNGEGDTAGLDSVYASVKEELASKSAELQAAVQAAMEDGVISTEPVTLPDGSIQISEYEAIASLQNQISDIVNRVSAAESEAKLDVLQIKYGGANLDAASFKQLQSELAANMESMASSYDEALEISLTNLRLQFPDGGEEFDAAKAKLEADFNERMKELNLRVEGFQLDTIAQAFASDLDKILPDLTGNVSERLKQAMDAALAIEPDPVQWTAEQITQWFGLDGLDAETAAAVGGMLQSVAETIPEAVKTQLKEGIGNADVSGVMDSIADDVVEAANNVDMSGAMEAIGSNAAEAAQNVDMSEVTEILQNEAVEAAGNADLSGMTDSLQGQLIDSVSEADFSGVTEAYNSGLGEAIENIEVSGAADILAETIGAPVNESLANIDTSEGQAALLETINSGVTEVMESADSSAGGQVLKAGLESTVSDAISNPEMSAAKEALRNAIANGVTEAIVSVDLSAAYAALATLRQALESQAQATLGAQMTIQVPVSLTYNYNVTNPTTPKPTVTAQTYTSNVAAHANGGFVSGAELSWVGEDGPEAIIPLGAKRRGRGLELYKQVGEILGVAKNAEGGVYGVADNSAHAHYDNHYGNRYDNRSVSNVAGGSALSNYDNRNASEITNQFAGASVAYLAPDGLHIVQYPSAGANTAYDTHDSRTDVSSVTGNSYRTESASVYAPFLSTHDTRRSAASSVLTENNSAETAYDAHNSRTDVSNVRLSSTQASQGGLSVSNIAGDSYRAVNAYDARRFDNSLHRTENNGAETAYNVGDSRTATYLFNETGGVSNTRSGNVYGGSVSLSAPVTNAYDAGTRTLRSDAIMVRNVRNPSFRGGDSYFAPTVTNIRNAGSRDWRETSLTEISPSVSSVNNSAASFNSFSPRFTAAYDMRRASNSHSYRTGANAETAYHTRNIHAASQNSVTDISPSTLTAYDIQSNPLSVFNGGDSLARSFLNGPTSIYDARTEADSFTDMSRTGEASYYNTDSLFRLPEEATAYSALEAPETPFESGAGFYPGDAESGDSGAETAFAPVYDAPADGGGTSGATSRNAPVTINVTLTPSFSFSSTGGESDEKMESFIRRCMKESADDLADELAERLIAVFENSPRR